MSEEPMEQKRARAAVQQRSWRNRRLIAERLRWPAGALATCEMLDRRIRAWTFSWAPASKYTGFERAAGFFAYRLEDDARVFGEDVAALLAGINAEPPPHEYIAPPGKCRCRRCDWWQEA
jgi:hypothetical protein